MPARLCADAVVNGCSHAELQSALAGGGTVTFNRDCDITLTNTLRLTQNTRLDASGFNVTIRSLFNAVNSTFTNINAFTNITSTNVITCLTNYPCVTNFGVITCITNTVCSTNSSSTTNITFTTNIVSVTTFTNGLRLFEVASNASVTLASLRLANGRSTNGGALYIHPGASVTLTNCTLTGHGAIGTNGTAGANGGASSGNGGDGGNGTPGGHGLGGAIYNLGALTLWRCNLSSNTAAGGNGGNGGNGGTGSFRGGDGGAAGSGGVAHGGAVFSQGPLWIQNCTFAANRVLAGHGGHGGTNGSGGTGPGLMGNGGGAGTAWGAGLYSAQTATVLNSTFSDNTALGGNGAAGGTRDNGSGYDGARGGNALGGGIYGLGSGAVTNCTFYHNKVTGGNGGNGGPGTYNAGDGGDGGTGSGGGLYCGGSFTVVNATFSTGSAVGGTNGVAGSGAFPGSAGSPGLALGGNVARGGGTLLLKNSIVATNLAGGGGYGVIVDAGHNISADASLALGAGSLKNTNPRLGSFANNGGPTLTLSLLPGSPAIDAADDAAAPKTDQRGIVRPAGVRADIGAVEVGAPVITKSPENQTRIVGSSVSFDVLATGDATLLYQWRFRGTNLPGATSFALTISNLTTNHAGPYQVVVSNNFGALTSAVANLTITTAPAIVSPPTNLSVLLGQTAGLSVTAAGLAPLRYQWHFNGTSIPGATTNIYSRTNAQIADAGSYTVVITNDSGSVTSQPAVLTVRLNPALAEVQHSRTNFSFSYASGTGLTYVVEFKDDLNALAWTPIATNVGTGNILTFADGVSNTFNRFYRVIVR